MFSKTDEVVLRRRKDFDMGFFMLNELEKKPLADGVDIRLISGEKMTMAFYSLKPGAIIPEHAHPHEQMGLVLKGSIELIIDKKKKIVAEGIAYHVPSNEPHEGRCLNSPAEVLEIFSPPREDLLRR